jgi:hypothetical protein
MELPITPQQRDAIHAQSRGLPLPLLDDASMSGSFFYRSQSIAGYRPGK